MPKDAALSSQASEEQKNAVAAALSQPFSYICGASGTGKTQFVLARCILAYVQSQKRIWITAPTNNAVEQMLYGVLPILQEAGISLRKVLRDYPKFCVNLLCGASILHHSGGLHKTWDSLASASGVFYEFQSLFQRGLEDSIAALSIAPSLPHLLPFSAPPNLRKQTVFLYNSQDGFEITVETSLLQYPPHPAVAIYTKAVLSLFRDDFCKGFVFLRLAQTMDEIIVSAAGYLKEATHNGYRIFISVSVDHCIFFPWPHFLSVEHRKSRSNSFSIFSCLFSYLYSASVFAGLRPVLLVGKVLLH